MDFHNFSDKSNSSEQFSIRKIHDKLHFPINFAIHPSIDRSDLIVRIDYDSRYFSDIEVDKIARIFDDNLNQYLSQKLALH